MKSKLVSIPILFLGLTFGIFGFAKSSQAATHYVRPAGACTYSGDGTAYGCAAGTGQAGAWISFSKITGLSAGDTTYVCGAHRTMLDVITSGNSSAQITFDGACPGDPGTIDTSKPVTGWTDAGGGIWSKVNTYTRILFEDGVPLKKATSAALSDGYWYHDGTGGGTLYYKPTSGVPTDHMVERQTDNFADSGVRVWDYNYVTIQNLFIKKATDGIAIGNLQDFHDIIIRNNTISQCGTAIQSYVNVGKVGSDIIVSNNRITYCQSGIKFLLWNGDHDPNVGQNQYTTGVVVRQNTLTDTGDISDGLTWRQAVGGVYDTENISSQDMSNSLIEENTIIDDPNISDESVIGIFLYGTNAGVAKISGNTIRRNYIFGNTVGLYVGTYSGVSLSGSLSGNNAGVENNMIADNVVNSENQKASEAGLYVNNSIANPATGNNYFINNTIYNIASAGRAAVQVGNNVGNWTFENNIIDGLHNFLINGQAASHYVIDHNIYLTTGPQKFYSGGAFKSYDAWKTDTGYDANSQIIDPLFTNSSGSYSQSSDFSLQLASPAINAGVDVGLTSDYAGNPIVGTPDIGAYEYQGASASTPPPDTTPPSAPTGLAVQ